MKFKIHAEGECKTIKAMEESKNRRGLTQVNVM